MPWILLQEEPDQIQHITRPSIQHSFYSKGWDIDGKESEQTTKGIFFIKSLQIRKQFLTRNNEL